MKLIKIDVAETVVVFIFFIFTAMLGTNANIVASVSNILIIFVTSLGALVTLFSLFGIRRYKTVKESVRNRNRYFKFIFYKHKVLLLSKDGASWIYTHAMGDIEQLKKVSHIEIVLYENRKGKPICPLCEDTGMRLSRPVRMMGYTIGPDEDPNILDEQLIPCTCGVNDDIT